MTNPLSDKLNNILKEDVADQDMSLFTIIVKVRGSIRIIRKNYKEIGKACEDLSKSLKQRVDAVESHKKGSFTHYKLVDENGDDIETPFSIVQRSVKAGTVY